MKNENFLFKLAQDTYVKDFFTVGKAPFGLTKREEIERGIDAMFDEDRALEAELGGNKYSGGCKANLKLAALKSAAGAELEAAAQESPGELAALKLKKRLRRQLLEKQAYDQQEGDEDRPKPGGVRVGAKTLGGALVGTAALSHYAGRRIGRSKANEASGRTISGLRSALGQAEGKLSDFKAKSVAEAAQRNMGARSRHIERIRAAKAAKSGGPSTGGLLSSIGSKIRAGADKVRGAVDPNHGWKSFLKNSGLTLTGDYGDFVRDLEKIANITPSVPGIIPPKEYPNSFRGMKEIAPFADAHKTATQKPPVRPKALAGSLSSKIPKPS